ncbi:MAG: sigma 54-interacting transcriptional regulator [Proteobacteria bacterium]|nr:sigma 54-interacting transcriptional regulator [Pseudomonadota bacterium]MBU1387509.1 sigma 54-interacting transcriptional regulator [Pseudomonadota bacterium]MBU1543190.1 sigma 54-interacting transcriptional regulator [Pseudomonadota bacterium]MBU2430986.1 sigma 54-interacting transcriptional regulator [Pseudomonadota bacterium]MBU2482476.1 sigma 54-interacting transcriptional regulator [Pseudomonadota bacterium]
MKSIEETLKRYEAFLNEIEDGVGETDLEGNLTFVTDAGCRIWGYTRQELLGSNFKSYVDESGVRLLKKMYNQVYKTGKPVRFIHDVIRKDRTIKIVEDAVSPIFQADGTIVGFRSVQRDVTDRENAQKEIHAHRRRLEAIFSSVSDAIIMVDPDMRIIEANTSTEGICGFSIKDTGGKIFARTSALCGRGCYRVLTQTLDHKKNISGYTVECACTWRDHQLVSINSWPILDQNGELMGAVMGIRDITMLNDLQKELQERHNFHNIIGRSNKMQTVYTLLENLKDLDTTVLVTGETGTGKELVARAIHYEGQRALNPFIAVNCSALSENLLESELFGHVQGAFTGAIKDKMGRFEAAAGGTILLDEIGDISALVQLKLLRVLQEKIIERVGEHVARSVDARIIVCTNKNLKEKVAAGEFREDLYYRLKVVQVELPPLRSRLEDVPLLVDHFIAVFNKKSNQKIKGVSQDVLSLFMSYGWPGNIRELEHVIEHAFILCRRNLIMLDHLPRDIVEAADQNRHGAPHFFPGKKTVSSDEILEVLKKTDGNKAKAARLLGVNRRTLYRKLENLN